ncbi:MAG: hypothetical protein H0U21_07690 [Acidimicrobiia bacterium]|nr:hypothetical protein [Acidimicrobiia bacterium]
MMRRFLIRAIGLAAVASLAPLAAPVGAPVGAAPPEPMVIRAWPFGRLVEGGMAADIRVVTRCRLDGYEILESLIYLNQDGRSTNFAGLPIACDGQRRATRVRVRVLEGEPPLRHGDASISAYAAAIDPETNDDLSVSPVFGVRLLRPFHCRGGT